MESHSLLDAWSGVAKHGKLRQRNEERLVCYYNITADEVDMRMRRELDGELATGLGFRTEVQLWRGPMNGAPQSIILMDILLYCDKAD